jgi:carbonic anhydrase
MEYANLSRRSLLALGTAGALACTAASAPAFAAPSRTAGDPWARLAAGNARFAAGRPAHPRQDPAYRRGLVDRQQPFACVLGCADSRVPAELLFDQGLGDLFTVRAVGEMLDDAVVGSVEYAVGHLGVRCAPRDFLAACVRNQATRIADELPRRSMMIDTERVEIMAAVYDLGSGLVRRH